MQRLPLRVLLALGALVALSLSLALPPLVSGAADTAWHGEYFANDQFAGQPALVRSDPELKFDWKLGSPAPVIPVDHFSARWTRSVYFTPGQWRFMVSVDDGVRLFVDGQKVMDQWRISAPITYTTGVSLTQGIHDLRLEYYDNTERAQVRLWWEAGPPLATTATPQAPDHAGSWLGHYFANRTLSGNQTFERADGIIYFDWGQAGPGGGLSGDNFSVRWNRVVDFPAGRYRFRVTAADGVRLWFDWAAIIDQWHDSAGQTYVVEKDVKAGKHELVLEYYQAGGSAQAKLTWEDASVDWVGNLSTCMRPNKSWIKVYRLAPNNQWEDLRPAGYGPLAADGSLKLFGLPIEGAYGWDGQPYKVELWVEGGLVRSEGDIFAGQPAFRMHPGQTLQTSWPCGANIPQS
jgi:hypothetical protein